MSPSGVGLWRVIVGSVALLQVLSVLVACDRLCAFKREGLACVCACVYGYFSSRGGWCVGGGPD